MAKKYVLGLDIGISSCGWGVIAYNEESKKWELDDFGVRIWKRPEDAKSNDSNASFRREKRAQRRLLQRRKARIKDLISLVLKEKFLKEEDFIITKEPQEWKSGLSPDHRVLKATYEHKLDDILSLKVKALKEVITPVELVAILINYTKRRGYNNFFESTFEGVEKREENLEKDIENLQTKDKDKGLNDLEAYNLSIDMGRTLMIKYKENPYPSYIYLNDEMFKMKKGPWKDKLGFKNNVKEIKDLNGKVIKREHPIHVVFKREHYINELKKIFEVQEKFYPFIKNNGDKIIEEIIFRQRTFEEGPGSKDSEKRDREIDLIKKLMGPQSIFHKTKKSIFEEKIGKCQFVKSEIRHFRPSLLADVYAILKVISQNNLDSFSKENLKNFSKESIKHYLNNGKITSTDLRKIAKNKGFELLNNLKVEDDRINYLDSIKNIDKNWYEQQINKIDLENLETLKESEFEKFGEIIYLNRTPLRLKEELEKNFSFMQSKSYKDFLPLISKLKKTPYKISKVHILNSIEKILYEGIPLGKYDAEIELENQKVEKIKALKEIKYHFQPIVDWDMIPNATVFRSLNQSRRLLYALHKKYKFFDSIVIETSKDLYNDKKYRNEIQQNQKKNEELNSKALSFWNIKQSFSNSNDSTLGANSKKLLLYKLWTFQGGTTTNSAIDYYDFDSKTKKFGEITEKSLKEFNYEKDHIIPYSRHNDNSLNNLVITKAHLNQDKGNRTAYEYMLDKLGNEKDVELWIKELEKKLGKKKDGNIKKLTYLSCKNENLLKEDFVSQNLNDTRYISKYFSKYLEIQLVKWNESYNNGQKTNILNVNGKVTSNFRKMWLGNNPNPSWGKEKVRNITHFHHAVDGIVLANIINEQYNNYYTSLIKLKEIIIINYGKYKDNKVSKDDLIKILKDETENIISNQKYEWIEEINWKEEISIFSKQAISKIESSEKLIFNDIFSYIKPVVKNLQEVVIRRIPVKLKIEVDSEGKKEIVFDKWQDQKSWAKENSDLRIEDYPIVSQKIEAKVRGEFASETIYSKKSKEYKNNIQNFQEIKFNGGFIKTDSYLGLGYKEGESIVSIKYFDLLKNKSQIKYDKLFTSGVTFLNLDDQMIYNYRGLGGGKYQFRTKLNFDSNNICLLNRKVLIKAKILNVNILGKIITLN